MSWRNVKDTYESNRKALCVAETRVMAYLICKALGPEWHKVINEHGYVDLTHTSGFVVHMAKTWNSDDRYRFRPQDCKQRRDDPIPDEITVDAGRAPASIARDIENRILAKGAVEGFEINRLSRKADHNDRVIERLAVLLIARKLGARQLSPERRWQANCLPRTNEIHLNGMSIVAEKQYLDRFTLTIECNDASKLAGIAELINGRGNTQRV